MGLGKIGEFGLIRELRKMTRVDLSVRIGIGDDTAVLRPKPGKEILFTTDMLIEDRHFLLKEATPFEIGWKAMAVNVSDIAAMGGVPTHAVVAVALPKNSSLSFVKELYRGLLAVSKKFGVNIVGGDTNRSGKLVVSVALLGEVSKKALLTRSGAKLGDVIFVTGELGGAYKSRKHLNFVPRIREAQFLVSHFKVNAMIDISDGLSSDLRRITEESGVGAVVCAEAVPLSKNAGNVQAALCEGEDFELLFTMSPAEAAKLSTTILKDPMAKFSPVGKIVPRREGVKIISAGSKAEPLPEKGFDHFK